MKKTHGLITAVCAVFATAIVVNFKSSVFDGLLMVAVTLTLLIINVWLWRVMHETPDQRRRRLERAQSKNRNKESSDGNVFLGAGERANRGNRYVHDGKGTSRHRTILGVEDAD